MITTITICTRHGIIREDSRYEDFHEFEEAHGHEDEVSSNVKSNVEYRMTVARN